MMSLATVLLISLAIEAFGGNDNTCRCPTEGSTFNMSFQCMQQCSCQDYHCDWVDAEVPVDIIKLFTPNGACTRKSYLEEKNELFPKTCELVERVADLYVKAMVQKDSKRNNEKIRVAMDLMRQSINKMNFSCSNITAIRDRLNKESAFDLDDPDMGLHTGSIIGLFSELGRSERACLEACSDDAWLVCSVVATLLNITLDKETTVVVPTCPPEPSERPPGEQITQLMNPVMEWVKGEIPVTIIQLFLPEPMMGLCMKSGITVWQNSMCLFVKTVVDQINNDQSENDQSKNDPIASMHEAVSKKGNFDCNTWKVKATEVLKLNDTKLPLDALHTVAKAIKDNIKECEATCDKNHLCRVTSSLFDFFLKDKDLPLAEPSEVWQKYLKLTSPIMPILQLIVPDGLCNSNPMNISKVQSAMCNFTKALTFEYVTAKSKEKHDDKTTYIYDAVDRLGRNDTVDFNCSWWKSISERANGQATAVNSLPSVPDSVVAFFKDKPKDKPEACNKECTDQWRYVCQVTATLLDVLPDKPKPTEPGPIASKSNKATTVANISSKETSSPAKKSSSSAPSSENGEILATKTSAIIIIIVAVGVAVLAYIAYHNQETLQKTLGLCGKKKGRPKRKNYKHLKSVKDALP